MANGETAVLAGDTDPVIKVNDREPRDDRAKRRQIMDGARQVILTNGFDAASMNEIARVAGVSKGTLYVYFASKEDLFEALIGEEKREQAEQMCRFDDDTAEITEALARFGFRLLDRLLVPASIAHLRTVAAVSAKFPRIGQVYYEAGPAFGMRRLAAYLEQQAALGAIVAADDYIMAAHHFTELCKSYYLTRAIFGVGERPDDATLKAHVADAVNVFMRAYGTRSESLSRHS